VRGVLVVVEDALMPWALPGRAVSSTQGEGCEEAFPVPEL